MPTRHAICSTTLLLAVTYLVLSLAGVQPMASHKDSLEDYYMSWSKESAEELLLQKVSADRVNPEVLLQLTSDLSNESGYYQTLFNRLRVEEGKPPLAFEPQLNSLAKERSQQIALPGNFNHDGIKKYNLGENIVMLAYASEPDSMLIFLWYTSPGHRANMLSNSYTKTGFARNGKYAVQLFD